MTQVTFGQQSGAYPLPQGNPDEYAKQYAEMNGISIDEAKEQLRNKYGDPSQDKPLFDNFNASNTGMNFGDFSLEDLEIEEGAGQQGYFQQMLDFFRGNSGPQKEGDPQPHINPETGTMTGPSKEGDFNPRLNNSDENFDSEKAQREEYARQYAAEHGMTIDEAREYLKSIEGNI